jgi:uncharacterized protein (TIGR03083 family)
MGPVEYLTQLQANGNRLADVAQGHLDEQVPSCPDWKVADLLQHTGGVHRFFAGMVRTRAAEPTFPLLEVPSGEAIVDWYREGLAEITSVLKAVDPMTPIWTWTRSPDTASWVQRRMAQETAVHRWDSEAASEQTTPIDAALAIDGLNEFFDVFVPNFDSTPDFGSGTIHLHATDGEGEWLLTLDGAELAVERGHAKGDVAVRGTASDLLLVVWRRLQPADVEVIGDGAVLDRFLDASAIS